MKFTYKIIAAGATLLLIASPVAVFAKSNVHSNVHANAHVNVNGHPSVTVGGIILPGLRLGWFINPNNPHNSNHVTATTTPPLATLALRNVGVTVTGSSSANIHWLTNVLANSRVWFGASSTIDLTAAPQISVGADVFYHRVALTDLSASTTYYAIVSSQTVAGVEATSFEITFTTSPLPVLVAPTINFFGGPTNIMASTTNVWTIVATDPQSSALSYFVTWGDVSATSTIETTPALVQSVSLSHFYANPGTYTINVLIRDALGLTATSSITVTATSSATST